MSEANYDAKARAEARRRRILEASQTRMNVVSGLPTSSSSSKNITTTTNEDNGEQQQEQAADQHLGETEEISSAQKIAQMRRRRYGKKTENSTATTEQQQPEETLRLDDNEHNKKVTLNETKVDEINKDGSMNDENMEQKDELESADEAVTQEEESKESSKKYLGVAKMRRMKLAEKKAAEEAAFTRSPTASSFSAISPETKARILASKQSVKTVPAVLQLATVIMLFLSGLDIGIQNHVVVKQDVPYLHENLAYQDHGIGAFVKFTQKKTKKNAFHQDADRVMVEDYSHSGEDAEFDESYDTTKPTGASTSSKVSNIDPIFGVDFDALTAGTGFFYTCARFAVSVHRTLCYLFYTVPTSILQSILSIPKKMFTHPPIMFLCAILIRFLGKHVLGGNIPDVKEMVEADENMDKAHATSTGTGAASAENKMGGAVDKLASTNFMAMGGNYVKNYMKDNFPKATLAFTMFKDARADMLVVLCGFFVGLVLPVGVGVVGVKSNSDEL